MMRLQQTWRHFCLELISKSSGLALCLHTIFQNQHIEPGVFMGVRTRNDPIPEGERAFMLASTRKALEDGDTPVKVRNISGKKKQSGGSS